MEGRKEWNEERKDGKGYLNSHIYLDTSNQSIHSSVYPCIHLSNNLLFDYESILPILVCV